MGFGKHEPEQRHLLGAALSTAGISRERLWFYYLGLGGSVGEYEVEGYLTGMLSLPSLQRDLLAMAANEMIDDPNGPHAPYSEDFASFDAPPWNADSPIEGTAFL